MTGEIDISAADANQAYGALTEGLHIARYSLERAFCAHLEPLIGGNAWRKCGAGLDDINVFMDSLRLDKFRMIAEQRKQIVQRIKELQPDVSNRPVARTLGVHHDTVNRDVGGNPPGPENNDSGVNGLEDGTGGNPPEAAPYRTLGTGDNEWWTLVEHIACMRVDGEIRPLCTKRAGSAADLLPHYLSNCRPQHRAYRSPDYSSNWNASMSDATGLR
jgi:hypothetical protein